MKQTEKVMLTFIITILTLAMMASMTSCRGTKVVYEHSNGWNKMPKTSSVTGWTYSK